MLILKRCAVRVTALAALLLSCAAVAVPIVPGGFAETEGESNNVIPFTNSFGNGYQQIYDVAAFNGASGTIDSIAFRLDAEQAAGYSNSGRINLSVKLGTSARSGQSVSPEFPDNRRADQLEVFNGVLDFALADLPGSAPNPFALRIDFARPYFFAGLQDLLLELTLLEPLVATDPLGITLDAAVGPFGRAFETSVGNLATPAFGLITQFDITPAPVPEPQSLLIFVLGLGLLGLATRRGVRDRSH